MAAYALILPSLLPPLSYPLFTSYPLLAFLWLSLLLTLFSCSFPSLSCPLCPLSCFRFIPTFIHLFTQQTVTSVCFHRQRDGLWNQ